MRTKLASLAAIAVLAVRILEASANPPADGTALLEYAGKAFDVRDITLMKGDEVNARLAALANKYDGQLRRQSRQRQSYRLPSKEAWNVEMGRGGVASYYQHQLGGAVEMFLQGCVYEIVREKYPLSDGYRYDAGSLDEAIRAYAKFSNRQDSVMLAALQTAGTEDGFRAALTEAFPKGRFDAVTWNPVYHSVVEDEPLLAVGVECLPAVQGKDVAPWFLAGHRAAMVRYHVQAEIARNKQKYIDILEDEFGKWSFVVVQDCPEASLGAVRQLIDAITKESGEVAEGGREKANADLKAMGSPTSIECGEGDKKYISLACGIKVEEIVPRKFIPIVRKGRRLRSYLYIFQTRPTPHFTTYSPAAGTFLYDVGHRVILDPIIKDVLSRTKVSSKVRLRSVDDIRRQMLDAQLPDGDMYGEPIPQVLVK